MGLSIWRVLSSDGNWKATLRSPDMPLSTQAEIRNGITTQYIESLFDSAGANHATRYFSTAFSIFSHFVARPAIPSSIFLSSSSNFLNISIWNVWRSRIMIRRSMDRLRSLSSISSRRLLFKSKITSRDSIVFLVSTFCGLAGARLSWNLDSFA